MDIRIHTRFAIGESVFVEDKDDARIGVVTGICYYVNGSVFNKGLEVTERLYYKVRIGDSEVRVLGNALTREMRAK